MNAESSIESFFIYSVPNAAFDEAFFEIVSEVSCGGDVASTDGRGLFLFFRRNVRFFKDISWNIRFLRKIVNSKSMSRTISSAVTEL